MEEKKILVIEDDTFLNSFYCEKLAREHFSPLSALDGEEGLKAAREQKPDLILLDLMLPKKDGLTVLRELKQEKETAHIPVILLTNLSDEEHMKKALAMGAEDYLVKVFFEPAEIVEKIRKILKKKK